MKKISLILLLIVSSACFATDVKISQLTLVTSPGDSARFYIVYDSSGTNVSRAIYWVNLESVAQDCLLVTDAISDDMIDFGTGTGEVNLDDITNGATYAKLLAAQITSGVYINATTLVKGIASFSSDNFSVTSGAVSIKTGGVNSDEILDGTVQSIDCDTTGTNGIATQEDITGFITGNQTITLSGDASGSGTTAIMVTVADDSHAHTSSTLPGTTSFLGSTIEGAEITNSTITTVDCDTTGTNGIATQEDIIGFITGNQTITLSGDVTGSGTTAITASIATGAVGADELASTAVTPGSYTSANITVDADGRLTAAGNGTGGGGTWGSITGTIASQTDLQDSLDSKLEANQTITLSGDASGSGTTAIAVTVADDSHAHTSSTLPGTTSFLGSSISSSEIENGTIQSVDCDTAGTNGIATQEDISSFITGNQTITLSGDVSGSGTTAITVTVADDSHSHTSSTLPATTSYLSSAIESSEITNGTITTSDCDTTGTNGLATQEDIAVVRIPPTLSFMIEAPDQMAADTTQMILNTFGQTITIDSVFAISDLDDFTLTLIEGSLTGGGYSTIDSFDTSSNGAAGRYYKIETTITGATIENEHWICFKRPTESPSFVNVVIYIH